MHLAQVLYFSLFPLIKFVNILHETMVYAVSVHTDLDSL